MEKTIYRKGEKIKYQSTGEGKVIVLLHGYLESHHVWGEFRTDLAKNFHVLAIDLPGFGESDEHDLVTYIEGMADAVHAVVTAEEISTCFMVGHSMGGYVTLAFAEKYEDHLNGYCLFHSTPASDNEEKREHRRREIDLIDMGKKELIINFNIPNTFADDNVEKFKEEIERIKGIAIQTKNEGIKNALKGMMQRPDRYYLLRDFQKPILVVAGAKDNYIPLNISQEMAEISNDIQLEVFEESGHMGFIEEKEKAVKVIHDFAKKLKW